MTAAHEMAGLDIQSYTLEQFKDYIQVIVSAKMQTWRPAGFALHNTLVLSKFWPGFDSRGNQLSPAQRIKNMSVDWVSRGMTKAPHLLCTMSRDPSKPHMVHTMWPLWKPGNHSKGFNSWLWGLEMFADFDKEEMVPGFQQFVADVMRACYDMLGKRANNDNFKLHYEDPQTKHHGCPGIHARPKQPWIDAINRVSVVKPAVSTAAVAAVANDNHKVHLEFSPAMKAKLKKLEAFRPKAYLLKGVWHIGWGFRDGFRGMKIDANSTMTLAEADRIFEESMDALADTIQMFVKVPLKQYQLDALGLIAWNIGPGGLEGSTIVRKLNAEDTAGAADAFMMWTKWSPTPGAPKVESEELKKRREYEMGVFEGRIDLAAPPVLTVKPAQPAPASLPVVVAAKLAPKPGTAPAAPKLAAKAIPLEAPKQSFMSLLLTVLENLVLAIEAKDKPVAGGPR